MKTLTLKIENFWTKKIDIDFCRQFEILNYILNEFKIRLDQNDPNPDILLFSCYGELDKIQCYRHSFKIFYSAENIHERYPFSQYSGYPYFSDISLTFDPTTEQNFYYSNFFRKLNYNLASRVFSSVDIQPVLDLKTEFCCFLHSNLSSGKATKVRNKFMLELSKYKKVNSGGAILNNIGFRVSNQESANFIKRHKFIIAFENSSYPGYTTEKIANGFNNLTVPIYFGDPCVEQWFNPDAFINCNGKNMREAIQAVINLDEDNAEYKKYLMRKKIVHQNPKQCWQIWLKYHLEKIV